MNDYVTFLQKYLSIDPDALLWTLGYGSFIHSVDDIIDNEIPKDVESKEFLLKTFEFAAVVYSNNFYQRNIATLYPLVKMASNTYADSVQLESSETKWKRDFADVLRTTGNEVILAVIEIVRGYDIRRQASLEIRGLSYKLHHNELGEAV